MRLGAFFSGTVRVLQAYLAMKPSGGATPFLASSLELRRRARGYCRVQGGGGCDGLGEHSEKSFGRPVHDDHSKVGPHAATMAFA